MSTYEAGETFVQTLIVHLDGLLNSFKGVMTTRNYDALVSVVATDATTRLERAIKKSTFNRLGGLVVDQEVRTLGSYLTASTSWSVRDKMIRLTQIATLLNLEKVSRLWHRTSSVIRVENLSVSADGACRLLESRPGRRADGLALDHCRGALGPSVEVKSFQIFFPRRTETQLIISYFRVDFKMEDIKRLKF